METQEAIDVLQNIATGLENSRRGEQMQIDSLNVAISQLKNILDTPTADLVAAREVIAEKEAVITANLQDIEEKDNEIFDKGVLIAEKDARIAEMEAVVPVGDVKPM